MGKKAILACCVLSLLTPIARSSVEIKNQRLAYGPVGAKRVDNKFLPGDYLFISFDLEGLTFDPKTGKATYESILQLFEPKNDKPIFEKKMNNTVSAMLGGTRIPGDLHVVMGLDQKPGNYTVRLIIVDKLSKEQKNFAYFDHRFELQPADFGLVGVYAPAVGFAGNHYIARFVLMNMKLDAKNNPNVDVFMRVLDANGTQQMTAPITTNLPKEMPANLDLKKENFVEMQFPIYLNRSGRYTIEIEAIDRMTNRQSKLRYMLHVLDVESVVGR